MIAKTVKAKILTGAVLLTILLLGTVGVAAFSSHGAPEASQLTSTTFTPSSLSTSLPTSGGIWATVPMGRLSSPLTTFWQLLFRPIGTTQWGDLAGETETGTNGGLIFASPNGRTVDVAIRPTNRRTFSPIITTANNGGSWLNGLVEPGVANRTNALAANGHGALALVASGQETMLEASSTSLSRWSIAETLRGLAATVGGRTCGLTTMTAVAFLSGEDLVGGICTKAGVVPLFQQQGGAWRLARLTLPEASRRDTAQVLGLQQTSTGVSALVEISGHNGTHLLIASWRNGHWRTSASLPVPQNDPVLSYGPASTGGLFVMLATQTGVDRLEVFNSQRGDWKQLISPPKTTATLAFGPSTQVEALAESHSTLTVWRLASGTNKWVKVQELDILQGPTLSTSSS